LRQIYYQFVARDWFPERWADPATGSKNNQRSYQKLGNLLADARLGGLMDWEAMIDRTREKGGNVHWDSPQELIETYAQHYKIDKWIGQDYRPEVWVEKDALEGVVETVCRRLDIPFFSCRGFTSLTSIWDNAQVLKRFAMDGTKPIIFHLGDHDPSGIDMTRDVEERVRLFMDDYGDDLIFERVALNMDQIRRYNPPENPAKKTDSRYKAYAKEYGNKSWELDALDPNVIARIIETKTAKFRDKKAFDERAAQENTERALLLAAAENWSTIAERLEDEIEPPDDDEDDDE